MVKDNEEKYVANIYDKIRVGDREYIFVSSYTIVGSYNEEYETFIDTLGREYAHIESKDCVEGYEERGFYNLIKAEDLMARFDDDDDVETIDDAISRYDEESRESILLVGVTPEEKTKVQSIKIGCYNDKTNSEVLDNRKLIGDLLHDGDVNPNVAALFQEINDGVYSREDLLRIKENVVSCIKDLSSVLEQIKSVISPEELTTNIMVTDAPTSAVQEEKPRSIEIPDRWNLGEIESQIQQTIKGQNEHIERILTEIIRKERDKEARSRGILLTGSTGVGKTTIMKLIAKYLDRPFFKLDTLGLSVPGYVGKDIEEELYRLYVSSGRDKSKLENCILYLDEVDKKNSENNSDISGRGVINLLLELIEGKEYRCYKNMKLGGEFVDINTSNMIIFLSGAYNDVYKRLKAEKNGIGFGNTVKKGDIIRDASNEDFINLANVPDEFIGRVTIIKLNDLSAEVLREILLDSDNSALKEQIDLFRELGVDLEYTESYIDAIIENALKKKTGARGLKIAVEDSTWKAYHDANILYGSENPLESVTLNDETVGNPKVFIKTLRNSIRNSRGAD